MVAGAATGDPPTTHDHIKSSSQYEVYVVVFGSLGDQRLTGWNREHFGAIG
jgi:translation elongation factor EF-Tu-like GTPase